MAKITSLSERQSKLSAPTSLKPDHNVADFECTEPLMNEWLRKHALRANDGDTAQTYVVCRGTRRVVAYHCLAAGAVELAKGSGALRRNSPDPIPVVVLGRIAVDKQEAGKGLGKHMIGDAMKRSVRAARIIGAKAMLVHALNPQLIAFYERLGFRAIHSDRQTLFLPMKTIRHSL